MVISILKFLGKVPFLSEKQRLQLYPPFFFMRIKILELSSDWEILRLKLPLNMASRNMGNSMFGGYQASAADPVAALACAKRFPGHEVWTRSQQVEFEREGNSDLELRFVFPDDIEAQIKTELAEKGRSTPVFEYGFYREDGVRCTSIKNTVAIRPKGYQSRQDRKNQEIA